MAELDFSGLRADIENETSIPEFADVRRRARRHKRWRVLLNTARVLGVLVIATPAIAVGDIVFSHIYSAQAPVVAGVSGNASIKPHTKLSTPEVTRTVLAVNGIDVNHTYALVDVCQGSSCDLELSQVDPDASAAVIQQYGLLRSEATDSVADPALVVENRSTVIVSGSVNGAPRQSLTVSIAAAAGAIPSHARPIQSVVQGPIQVVRGARAAASEIANQPPITVPTLQSETAGWWVVGTMPAGALAVSVSHDNGRSWSTHTVGVVPDATAPGSASLVTRNGLTVFLLERSHGKVTLLRSTDGGTTWGIGATSENWPSAGHRGLVMTTGGALIAWFTSGANTTYLTSTDQGLSFHPLTGAAAPTGPIVSTGGGFVTLGSTPMASTDGSTWQSAYVPYVAVGD